MPGPHYLSSGPPSGRRCVGPLFGLETEYGLSAPGPGLSSDRDSDAAWKMVDALRQTGPCLESENGAGIFLGNGSRVYVDCAHPEYATPEVTTPWDAVRYTLAGDRLLERALDLAFVGRGRPTLFKTNVDYLGRTSWGAHESILYTARPRLLIDHLSRHLSPFLISRILFSGAGGFDVFSPGLSFVLSPRAPFIECSESSSSTENRAIVNTKDEALCAGGYRRLHLICGESLCSERALWLKAATTVLVVAMVDGGLAAGHGVELANPIGAFHVFAHDPGCRAKVPLASGGSTTALALQRHYLRLAETHAAEPFMPAWASEACREWRAMLDDLEGASPRLATTLDWAIRRAVFGRILAKNGRSWRDLDRWTSALRRVWTRLRPGSSADDLPDSSLLCDEYVVPPDRRTVVEDVLASHGLDWAGLESFLALRRELFECDLRFGELGGRGVFAALDRAGVLTHRMPGVDDVDAAMEQPPSSGRGRVRGHVIRALSGGGVQYHCDWSRIGSSASPRWLDLNNPFETQERWREVAVRSGIGVSDPEPVGPPLDWGPSNRRTRALNAMLAGRHDEAEQLLLGLVADHFETPNTHGHLARLYLASGDLDRARAHIERASGSCGGAPDYVVARTLWLRIVCALLDGSDAGEPLEGLRPHYTRPFALKAWTMGAVLSAIRVWLSDDAFEMVAALLRVGTGEDPVSSLDRFAWWTGTTAERPDGWTLQG